MTAHEPCPKTRTRLAYKYTQKEGWRHEVTVEIDEHYANRDGSITAMHKDLGEDLDQLGRMECERRNKLDGWERPQ